MTVLWNLPWNIYLTKSNLKYNNTSLLSHFWAFKAGVLTLFVLHYLTVTDEVRPPFKNRTLKTTGCISTSITSNVFLPNALHPSQDPLVSPGTVNIPLVNNRACFPCGWGPGTTPRNCASVSRVQETWRPDPWLKVDWTGPAVCQWNTAATPVMPCCSVTVGTVGWPLSGMHQSVILSRLFILSCLLHDGSLCWSCCCCFSCCFAQIWLLVQWLLLSIWDNF